MRAAARDAPRWRGRETRGKRERREAAWVLAKEGGAESEGGEALSPRAERR